MQYKNTARKLAKARKQKLAPKKAASPSPDLYPEGTKAIVQCENALCVAVKGKDGIWRDKQHCPVEVVMVVEQL
jgi:hypothetical protein